MSLIPNHRKIAQQQRRAREREANKHALEIPNVFKTSSQPKENNNILPPNCRKIAQKKRRAQEQEICELTTDPRTLIQSKKRHLTSSSQTHPKFGTCCLQGKVVLQLLQDTPLALHQLF
nr:8897_t:CDS:2 [Entrophospora candida]